MSDNGATTTQGQNTLKRPGNVTAYDGRPLFCLRTVINVEQASAQELPTNIPTIPARELVRGSTGRGVR